MRDTSNVPGDFSIGHNAEIGGHQRVRGNGIFDHNVTVKGYLRAWNIESMFLGFFVDLADAPDGHQAGNYIFVKDDGSTTTASIYYWTTSGWVDSGMDTTLPTTVDVEDTTIPYEAVFESGEIVNETEIIDNLTTDSAHDVLSAKQGKRIWDRIVPVEATLAASVSNPQEYTGNDLSVTLTWTCKRDGVNKTPTQVVIKKGVTTIETISTPLSHTGTYSTTVNALGDTTFTVEITADGLTATASKTVQQVLPSYVGFYTYDPSSIIHVSAATMKSSLTKKVLTSVSGLGGTYTNDSNTKYLTLLVPNSLTITKVTSSGFDVPMQRVDPDDSIECPTGTTRTYKVYRSASPINAGDMTIAVQ